MLKDIGKERNGLSHFQTDIAVATLKKNLSALMTKQLNSQMNTCPNMQKIMPMLHLVWVRNTLKKNMMITLPIAVMKLQKVRKKMMIKIPKCPECGSDTAPDLIEINILDDDEYETYEELYECKCGCRYVALTPRYVHERTLTHKIVRQGTSFCLSTQY